MSTIAISARIRLHADSWEAYLAAAAEIVPITRREQGCVHYAFATDLLQPHVVWISEQWASEADLMAHLSAPHISDFLAKTAEMQLLETDIKKYVVSEVGAL